MIEMLCERGKSFYNNELRSFSYSKKIFTISQKIVTFVSVDYPIAKPITKMTAKEEQFRKIVEENQERVWNICRHYARSNEDTRDLQQEVMINIWRNLDSFRGDAALSTWIYRIAVNTCLSYIMKENRRSDFNLSMDLRSMELLMQEDDKAEKILNDQKLDNLHNTINQLTVIDKLLISLSIEKVTTREMADIIGITEPNVRTKLHRIREELRQKMKGGNNGCNE
jgi:RNA polymerase sigma-70 factor, ECF subfamily